MSADDMFLGFSVGFGATLSFGLVSGYFISRMYDAPPRKGWWDRYGLPDLVSSLASSNLGRFITYSSLMNFAAYLASPFFAVYMLRDLRFDYLAYAVLTVAASLASLVSLAFWGRRADRLGNVRVVSAASILIPLVPLPWLVSHQLCYLISAQILSGFAWSGFSLASANFVYDASAPEIRTRYTALFNAVNGGKYVPRCTAGRLPGIASATYAVVPFAHHCSWFPAC